MGRHCFPFFSKYFADRLELVRLLGRSSVNSTLAHWRRIVQATQHVNSVNKTLQPLLEGLIDRIDVGLIDLF